MQCGWGNGGGELGWWWRSLHALVHTHNPGWDTQPSFTHTHTHTNTNWPHTHTHYRYSCRQTRQTSCHTHLTETNRNSTLPYLLSFMELQMCSFIHSFSSLTLSFFRNSHMSPEVKHQSKLMISLGPPPKKKKMLWVQLFNLQWAACKNKSFVKSTPGLYDSFFGFTERVGPLGFS